MPRREIRGYKGPGKIDKEKEDDMMKIEIISSGTKIINEEMERGNPKEVCMKNIFAEKVWAWVILRESIPLPDDHWASRLFGLIAFIRDADIAKDFKSNEGWCLAIYRSEEEMESELPVAVIPGCSVRALLISREKVGGSLKHDPWTDLRIAEW